MKTECKKGRIIPKNIHEGPLKLMGRYRLLNEEDSANMGELPNTGILLVCLSLTFNRFFPHRWKETDVLRFVWAVGMHACVHSGPTNSCAQLVSPMNFNNWIFPFQFTHRIITLSQPNLSWILTNLELKSRFNVDGTFIMSKKVLRCNSCQIIKLD